MNDLITKIVGLIAANDGSLEWSELLANISFQEQRLLMDAVRTLESQGTHKRTITRRAGQSPLFTVDAVSSNELPEEDTEAVG